MIVFENQDIQIMCTVKPNGSLALEGTMITQDYKAAQVFAASPIQRSASYMGSAMPYPNPDIAFDSTPNRYDIEAPSATFFATFWYPNSYYTVDGRNKVLPSLFVKIVRKDGSEITYRFTLPDPFQLRTMTHREDRRGPDFYKVRRDQLGVQSQDTLLRIYSAPYLY